MTSATQQQIVKLAVERETTKSQARRNSITRQIARLARQGVAVAPAPKPARKPKTDWRQRPASDKQIARIHFVEKALGYKPSTRAAIGTAGQASDLYASLKAERNA